MLMWYGWTMESRIHDGSGSQEVIIRIVVEHGNQPTVSIAPQSSIAASGVATLSPTGLMSLPSRSRQYNSGQPIFRPKDKADTLMILENGSVRTFLVSSSGHETASRVAREGEI